MSILGGVVAYVADRLGRNLGKKRLSLFGLRPRHTAEVLTVAAGMLIPLITLMVILTASSAVRRWLEEGPALIAQRDQALADVKKLETERQGKTKEVDTLNRRFSESQSKVKSVEKELATAGSNLTRITAEFKRLTANYERVARQYRSTKANLAALESQYKGLEKTYTSLNQSYTKLHEQQKAQFAENIRLIQDNLRISKEVEQGKQDSANLKSEFEAKEAEYQRIQNGYQHDIQSATRELERKLNELDEAKAMLEVQRNLAAQEHAALSMETRNSRYNPLMFQSTEEVARLAIDPGLNRVQARAALDDLLRVARLTATARGALPRQNGLPAAGLFPRTDEKGRTISIEEQENNIVDEIANSKEDLVLVAYSPINAFVGESVALGILKFPNPIVFHNGQTIADVRIDARAPERDIVKQVTDFLQKDVNDKAKQANMVPNLHEPVIQVTLPEIVDLVKLLKIENRSVRLYATADGDIRAAGPLKLSFHYQ